MVRKLRKKFVLDVNILIAVGKIKSFVTILVTLRTM